MIRIHAALFLVLLELLLIAIGVGVYLFIRGRRLAREARPNAAAQTAQRNPDAGQYLLTEEKLTRARINVLTSATNLDDRDDAAVAALALRADYLQMEHELTAVEERDEAFWKTWDQRAKELRAQHAPAPMQPTAPGEEPQSVPDSIEARPSDDGSKLQELIDTQDGTIRSLQRRLDEAIGDDLTRQELQQELGRLERANREMLGCIKVLEDESEFLRKQIAELVQ